VTPSSSVEHHEDERQEGEKTKQEVAKTRQEEAKTKQEEERTKQEEAKTRQEEAKTRAEEERTKQVVEEGRMSVPVRLSRSDSEEIGRMESIGAAKNVSGPRRKKEKKS